MQLIIRLISRLYSAYQVFRGFSIAIPVYDSDTSILVIETEGSKVTYFKAINLVAEDTSYCLDLSKVFLWVSTKPRFFWKADPIGSKVLEEAEIELKKHENNSDNLL